MQIPTFYVLVPNDKTPAGITYARRWFQRITRPGAGVWSIESGQFQAGHHLNIIADQADTTAPFKGHVYAEPIKHGVRVVAAYITKAERAATKAEGFARQTGDLGNVAHWLHGAIHAAPVIAAAQLQHELDPHYLAPTAPGPERHHDTARRHLARIYEMLAESVAAKQHAQAE
jgi:hypothetical protein